MAVSVPVTLNEVRSSDIGPLRMNSMGGYNIMDSRAQVLPNYLRASIGSCHDICKYGRKRDFTMETGITMPGKLPGSPNTDREPNKSNNQEKRNSIFCNSRSPSTVKMPVSKVRTKEIQTGAKKLVATAKDRAWNYGINASKQNLTPRRSKNSISVSKTEVKKVLKKEFCDAKAEIESASVEDIPEKILFITELNSEKQAVELTPEEDISDDSFQCQKQIDASLLEKTEEENYIDKEVDLVELSPRSPSSKETTNSQSHGSDSSTTKPTASLSSSAAETDISPDTHDVSGGSDDKENEWNNVVLKHQDAEQKRPNEGLFNDVIEETTRKMVKTNNKVKALVHAFETVISLQDLSLQDQLKCGELPKFPLCTVD